MLLQHTPFRHKSVTAVALLCLGEPEINSRGFASARPALTCLQFAPRDINYQKVASTDGEVV